MRFQLGLQNLLSQDARHGCLSPELCLTPVEPVLANLSLLNSQCRHLYFSLSLLSVRIGFVAQVGVKLLHLLENGLQYLSLHYRVIGCRQASLGLHGQQFLLSGKPLLRLSKLKARCNAYILQKKKMSVYNYLVLLVHWLFVHCNLQKYGLTMSVQRELHMSGSEKMSGYMSELYVPLLSVFKIAGNVPRVSDGGHPTCPFNAKHNSM